MNIYFHFTTATKQWLQPTVEGDVPEGRGVHTLTVVGDQLVLYGGSSDFRDMQCHKFYNDVHVMATSKCYFSLATSLQPQTTRPLLLPNRHTKHALPQQLVRWFFAVFLHC